MRRDAAPVPHQVLSDFIKVTSTAYKRDRPYWHRSIERFIAGENRPEHEIPKLATAAIRNSLLVVLIGVLLLVAAVWLFQNGV